MSPDRGAPVSLHPSSALALQRLTGNAAVTGLILQRRANHTAAARVPRILATEPLVAGYAGEGGGPRPTVRVHAPAAFRRAYIAHAVGQGRTPEEAANHAPFVTAYTDLATGVVHLNRDRGDPGTVVHEALHLRSSRAFVASVHTKVNEGMTELFTRRVCAAAQLERNPNNYIQEHAAVERLVQLSSPEAVAAVYFTNQDGAIRSALDAHREGLWVDWQIAMIRSMSAATALLDRASGTRAPAAGAAPSAGAESGAPAGAPGPPGR